MVLGKISGSESCETEQRYLLATSNCHSHGTAIGRERDRGNGVGGVHRLLDRAGRKIPENKLYRILFRDHIEAAGYYGSAIGRNGQSLNGLTVPSQFSLQSKGFRVEDIERL